MAFWGIEVKPGSPVIHSCEKARGRLRISQATLGIGEATKKTVVQCNVGNRSPVLLCALLPDKTESCHLDLEFAEADDVVFSVIGPRRVYLTGYYVTESRNSVPQSDSESYGVDIQNSQSEGSSRHSEDDDEYEDSFIDDGELQCSPPSPVSSCKTMDESDPENNNPKGIKGLRRQLKKRIQVVESDTEAHESDNDDGFRLSVFNERAKKTMSKAHEAGSLEDLKVRDNAIDNVIYSSELKEEVGPEIVGGRADAHESDENDEFLLSVFNKRAKKKTVSKALEADSQDLKLGDNAINNVICSGELIKEVGPQVVSGRADREAEFPLGNKVTQVKNKKKKLPKELETLGKTSGSDDQLLTVCNVHENMVEPTNVNQNIPTNDTSIQIDAAKKKKKRKGRTKEEKTCKCEIDEDHSVIRGDKEHEVEASTNMGIGANGLVLSPEPSSKSGQKWKKRRKELRLEGTCTEETVATCHNVSGEDKTKQGLLHIDGTMKDQPTEGGVYKEQNTDNEPAKKLKKRSMKKPQDEGNPIMGVPGGTTDNKQATVLKQEGHTTNEMPTNKRTLSNELSIEVLANGPPDGKVAAPGKKVKIYYTAILKETGHIFDSNVGKSALKFRLGDKEFIDGWTFGIDGMHVGEKRRLVVPPSMGFQNHEENVPPNSWLVYDIELVGVHG